MFRAASSLPPRSVVGLLIASSAVVLSAVVPANAASTDPDAVSWLCRPGLANDPCEIPLDTTALKPDGTSSVTKPDRKPASKRPIDCFYVYPTVSNQLTPTATKAASSEITSIARFQAAPFSTQCRMFAPTYRQITLAGIPIALALHNSKQAYADVKAAWEDYLAHDNHGRGVVFISHSQGTILLRKLLREEVDPKPKVRKLLVGATMLGGNVLTAKGSTKGGDFKNIPVCTQPKQAGCVVAFSTYAQNPLVPFFGSSSFDVLSPVVGLPTGARFQVACTDPGPLSGITNPVGVTIPTQKFALGLIWAGIEYSTLLRVPTASTTWVTSRDRYQGACKTINGAHIYRYDPVGKSMRPLEFPPTWGTHLFDVNLGVERLVKIVARQSNTWRSSQ